VIRLNRALSTLLLEFYAPYYNNLTITITQLNYLLLYYYKTYAPYLYLLRYLAPCFCPVHPVPRAVHKRAHTHTCTRTHAHMHALTHTHTHTPNGVYSGCGLDATHAKQTRTHAHTHTSARAHTHACTHVHMHTNTRTHTHIHLTEYTQVAGQWSKKTRNKVYSRCRLMMTCTKHTHTYIHTHTHTHLTECNQGRINGVTRTPQDEKSEHLSEYAQGA